MGEINFYCLTLTQVMNKKFPKFNPYFISIPLTAFLHPALIADQIANSSIDLKKDVESLERNNFQNQKNLEAPINNLDKNKDIKNDVSEKSILLNSVSISGNKKYSDKQLYKFFKPLIGKNGIRTREVGHLPNVLATQRLKPLSHLSI